MAKTKTVFYCTECGNESPKWQGRCPACGQWNTMQEHIEKKSITANLARVGFSRKAQPLSNVDSIDEIRFSTGVGELDRVLGGGAVVGSLVLVGGAPGIGNLHYYYRSAAVSVKADLCYIFPEKKAKNKLNYAQNVSVYSRKIFMCCLRLVCQKL